MKIRHAARIFYASSVPQTVRAPYRVQISILHPFGIPLKKKINDETNKQTSASPPQSSRGIVPRFNRLNNYIFPFLETLLFFSSLSSGDARFINRETDDGFNQGGALAIFIIFHRPGRWIMVDKEGRSNRWWSGLIRSAIIGVAWNWMYRAITRGPNRHFGPINDMDSWLGDVRSRGSIRH